jgi:hypothetical protein
LNLHKELGTLKEEHNTLIEDYTSLKEEGDLLK